MKTVDVLLATFNGEKFLEQQLASLASQTNRNFRLLFRDDGSKDSTIDIIKTFLKKDLFSAELLADDNATGAAKLNFQHLMMHSDADYIAFCDQDDIWHPEKIEKLVSHITECEKREGNSTPLYVYSDAKVIHSNGNLISSSYWNYKCLNPRYSCLLNRSLICPYMLGCTSIINRALLRKSLPLPESVTGHDWWCQLVAAAIGKVEALPEPLISYRIHGGNSSTPTEVRTTAYMKSSGKIHKVRHGLKRRFEQAAPLLELEGISDESRQIVSRFVEIQDLNFLRRRLRLIQGKYLYPDAIRNLATLLAM